jgi:hypothetical protein
MYNLENWKTRLKLALREPTKQNFMSKLRLKILLKCKFDQHWHKLDIETNNIITLPQHVGTSARLILLQPYQPCRV